MVSDPPDILTYYLFNGTHILIFGTYWKLAPLFGKKGTRFLIDVSFFSYLFINGTFKKNQDLFYFIF